MFDSDEPSALIAAKLATVPDPVALLQGLFAASPVAYQIYRADGHCLVVNQAFRDLFGSEPPPEYNVLADDVAEARGVLGLIRRAFTGEVVHTPPVWYDPRELRQVHVTEGKRVAIESTFFPLFGTDRAVSHVAIAFRDVTAETLARESAEHAAARARDEQVRTQHANEMLEAIIGASPLAVLMLDSEGTVKLWNPAAERMFGWRADEVIGRRHPAVQGEARAEFDTYVRRVIAGETIASVVTRRLRRDGSRLDAAIWAAPVRRDGNVLCLAMVEDVSERLRGEAERRAGTARLRVLAEASKAFASTGLALNATLDAVARFTAEALGDGCAISLASKSGDRLEAIAVHHPDPTRRALGLAMFAKPYRRGEGLPGRVLETGEPVLVPVFQLDHLPASARLEAHEYFNQARPHSLALVPIRARGRVLGVLAVGREREGPSYDADDLALLQDLADRAALAVENAQLFEDVRAEQERGAFIAEASRALATSLDFEPTLQRVAALGVPVLGDWCFVDLLDGTSFERVGIAHSDPSLAPLARRFRRRFASRPDLAYGVSRALATSEPQFVPDISDELLVALARDEDHLDALRALRAVSFMTVPLVARGRALGTITYISTRAERRYAREDFPLVEEVARRAAVAIDNARLYAEARAARAAADAAADRAAILGEVSEALASSLDYTVTLERVVRLAVPRIADIAGVYELEGDGTIKQVAVAHVDTTKESILWELHELLPLRLDQDRLLTNSMRTGEPLLAADVAPAMLESWAPSNRADEIVQKLAIRSYMAVPLRAHGRVLGALTLTTSDSGRRFDASDVALGEELARRVGVAIENARLYRAAQEASRLKDEFLATVSHELRTPLTAMLGWTRILRSGNLPPDRRERALETVERNARAQAQLIEDLLDISRIITGRLRLTPEGIDPVQLCQTALEAIRPAADAKGVQLVERLDATVGTLYADIDRLQQVVWNMLANAVKFTPRGGTVTLALSRTSTQLEIIVEDTGQGIAPEFLPHVFERFRQGDGSSTRSRGGLGLGLAIVRHLVELHGGSVEAHSEGEGRGARFIVRLPIDERHGPAIEPRSSSAPPIGAEPAHTHLLAGLRVLVVEDEADARELLGLVVTDAGGTAECVTSAADAIARLGERAFDVLVSDIGMPGEDGYALMRRVRQITDSPIARIPAVAVTAYARAEDRARALAAGFNGHVSKPVDVRELVLMIGNVANVLPRT